MVSDINSVISITYITMLLACHMDQSGKMIPTNCSSIPDFRASMSHKRAASYAARSQKYVGADFSLMGKLLSRLGTLHHYLPLLASCVASKEDCDLLSYNNELSFYLNPHTLQSRSKRWWKICNLDKKMPKTKISVKIFSCTFLKHQARYLHSKLLHEPRNTL